MNRRMYSLFPVVAASAVLLAGCGGSSSSSSSSTKTATHTSSSTAHPTAPAPSTPSALGGVIAAYCKNALASAKTLTPTEKSQFESYCASLTNVNNPTQLKAAEKKLCTEIIKDTVPSAEQSAASAECSKL